MRKTILLTLFIAIGISITSCINVSKFAQNSMLDKSWTHSMEESNDKFDLYRPSDFKEFPMSRYRQVFVFKGNNVCEYLELSPTDAHSMKKGKWDWDENTNVITIYNQASEVTYEFEVLDIKKDHLKVKMKN